MRKSLDFWKALFVFIGTIIGVGIFGLPWVGYQGGFLVLAGYFLILSTLAIVVHLLFAEVCLKTESRHRLPGYVRLYLGKRWSILAYISICIGLFGAQLAYLIVGGEFLAQLFSPYLGGNFFAYTLVFFIVGSFLIFKDIKSISLTEIFINLFFFAILFLFLLKALPNISSQNFTLFNPKNIFLPYGVVLFSLWGSAIIPEIKEMLGGDRQRLRKVIIVGIILAALTYLLFSAIVIGVSGAKTSEEALIGLQSSFGDGILKIAYVFGVITCFSSFLTLGLTLKKTFWYDLKLSERKSWAIASFVPLALYLFGFKSFIEVISLSGAIAIGIEGIIDVSLYKKVLKEKSSIKMNPAFYFLSVFLLIGALAKIINYFKK